MSLPNNKGTGLSFIKFGVHSKRGQKENTKFTSHPKRSENGCKRY